MQIPPATSNNGPNGYRVGSDGRTRVRVVVMAATSGAVRAA